MPYKTNPNSANLDNFFHNSFNSHLLNTYYVLGTVLNVGVLIVCKRGRHGNTCNMMGMEIEL